MNAAEDTGPSTSGRDGELRPDAPPKLRQCRGALWYSTSRYLQQKPPVRRHSAPHPRALPHLLMHRYEHPLRLN